MQRDHSIGLDEAQPDHRHERGAAGDQARLAVEPGQRVERRGQRVGLDQVEGVEAHAHLAPGAAASTASTIFV